MIRLFIFIIFISMTNNLIGQHEFIVNTFKDSTQSEPSIELIDGTGNFVIVWKSENQVDLQSEGDIYLKYFSSELIQLADEILVNDSTIGPQQNPQISSNRKGKFVVVWSSYDRNFP